MTRSCQNYSFSLDQQLCFGLFAFMATPTKKGSKTTKAKPPRGGVKTSPAKRGQTIAELRQELEARNRDLAALYDVTAAASQSLEIKPVLDEVVKKITEIFAFDAGVIYLFDPQREYLNSVASFGTPPLPRAFRRGQGLTGRVAETGEPILFENVQTDPRYQELSQSKTAQQRDYCFFAIFPIKSKQRFLGTINCSGKQPRQLVAEEIRLIRSMCDQIGVAVENINLFEEVRNKTGELESSNSELREALEQQTATSGILGVIASSPTDIQPVLDAVARSAARLCESYDAVIHRVDGDHMQRVAHFGPVPVAESRRLIGRGLPMGRAIVDAQTIHVHDVLAEVGNDFPDAKDLQQKTGTRTVLAIPLLRKGVAIGVINVRRTEVRPFSENQIALLKTFADQAVIAIENVRLFKELGERNAELHEALEHQTATAEVLGIISRSPTDVQPVLDAIVESAARVCGIDDVVLRLNENNALVPVAHFGPIPIGRVRSIDEPQVRWMREHGALHVPDVRAQNDFPTLGRGREWRTFLAAPLRQQGEFIGLLAARRMEVRPFSTAQIKLMETFADQAVIALENVRLFQELKESLEQQTATSEILGVIASSPTDIQPVLDVVAENAARLCEATDAQIRLIEGDSHRLVASFGNLPAPEFRPASPENSFSRAIFTRETIHIHDLQERSGHTPASGTRTLLSTPMLREGTPIGLINIRRTEVRPFSDRHIKLLETFAAQAVIAIENVRLFKELGQRNAELREALEHQTATAEVLGIISRSPTDVQPVLDAIVESAGRVCGIDDVLLRLRQGNSLVSRAHFGSIPIAIGRVEISIDEPRYRWMREHGALYIPDVRAQNEFPGIGSAGNFRTFLVAPLLHHGELIGVLTARHAEVRPFTPTQIKLLETFADQAVIAIENVRLFQELKESLEQQTATSEILGVIASSPTEIQPVLNTVAENAARVCGATDAVIFRIDGNSLNRAAHYGPILWAGGEESSVISRGLVAGRAVVDRRTIHIHDMATESETEFPEGLSFQKRAGHRTILATPLLREGIPIGTIMIRRTEIRPFSEKQIKLLETFASQAVIAIENVRLFKELEDRNAELREALEHQTATSEVLSIINRSPTDVQPVLDAIVESAAKVCGIDDVLLRLIEGDSLVMRAHIGSIPLARAEISIDEPQVRWIREHGTLHVPDVRAQNDFPTLGSVRGCTFLGVPLRQQGELIGGLTARRIEVRPFTPAQIKLLETFADQAVIAIENVRLFNELKESLEQQTATSEVLKVISRSVFDLRPVLETLTENAVRLCGADMGSIYRFDGERLNHALSYNATPELIEFLDRNPITPGSYSVAARAALERQTIHVPDVLADPDFTFGAAQLETVRTVLGVPMMRGDDLVGVFSIRNSKVQPFTDRQIELVTTFADQAVIAIENVRLFQELEARTRELSRSVGELKALGEVGQTVSSTLDLQTVLSTIVRHAVQLSGTDCGIIYEYDEAPEEFHLRASYRMEEKLVEVYRTTPIRLGQGATGRAAVTRAPVQVVDLLSERELAVTRIRPMLAQLGYQSLLAVPLLFEDHTMGALTVYRREAGSFAPEVVNLLQTFATQSALAIQNARLFREIEDKSRQIEAANRHKSEFLANMSHELRTPLTAIIGFSEVLSEKVFGELNDKQSEYMDDIVSSGRHLLSLINDILDLSKVEAGRMELDLTRFDMPTAIDNALILIRERATRHGITLRHTVDERLGEVLGDERKFKQILLNLLSNAVKFTAEGGYIDVDAALTNGAVEVSVSDTGIGIAPENQEAIFEEFRQVGTDFLKKREGTGLGLTLTRKFVELHGGKIWVESAVGKGSTFTFTLPLQPREV